MGFESKHAESGLCLLDAVLDWMAGEVGGVSRLRISFDLLSLSITRQ